MLVKVRSPIGDSLRAQGFDSLLDGRKVLLPQGDGRVFEELAIVGFTFPQRPFHLYSRRDVFHAALVVEQPAFAITHGPGAVSNPDEGAIVFSEPRLKVLDHVLFFQCGLPSAPILGVGVLFEEADRQE